MWALEFTSTTAGPSGVRMMSTPAKSAPTASAARTASSASPSVGTCPSIEPPIVALERKSPSGALLAMPATARPPMTSTRRSRPPHSTYSWRMRGTDGPSVSDASSPMSCARCTCMPKDPKQSLTTIGNPRVPAALSRNVRSENPLKDIGQATVLSDGTPCLDSARWVRALSSHSLMHSEELNTGMPQSSRFSAHLTSLSQNTAKSTSPKAERSVSESPTGTARSALVTLTSSTERLAAAAAIISPGSEYLVPGR